MGRLSGWQTAALVIAGALFATGAGLIAVFGYDPAAKWLMVFTLLFLVIFGPEWTRKRDVEVWAREIGRAHV
jgi:hypothetical protein